MPYDHPESNYRMAREAMFAKVPVPPENIFPIPTNGEPARVRPVGELIWFADRAAASGG